MSLIFAARSGVCPIANIAISHLSAVTSSINVANELLTKTGVVPRSFASSFAKSTSIPLSCCDDVILPD